MAKKVPFNMAHKIAMMESGLNKVKPKTFADSDPDEYFFVADYDPEDEYMFDMNMYGGSNKFPMTPEGLQEAMALLEEAKQEGNNFNIYRRKYSEGRGDSDEEIISDPFNYQFPKKK
jgi:hypothetical protein